MDRRHEWLNEDDEHLTLILSPDPSDCPYCSIIVSVQEDPAMSSALADLLEGPGEDAVDVFERVERARWDSGAPAAVVYDAILDRTLDPRVRSRVVELLAAEGTHAAIGLLERRAARAIDENEKRLLRKALLLAWTSQASGSGDVRPRRGQAWTATLDGPEEQVLVASLENPDGSRTVVMLSTSGVQGIVAASVSLCDTRFEARQLVEGLGRSLVDGLQEIGLGEADVIAQQAAARMMARGMALTAKATSALAQIERPYPAPAERFGTQATAGA